MIPASSRALRIASAVVAAGTGTLPNFRRNNAAMILCGSFIVLSLLGFNGFEATQAVEVVERLGSVVGPEDAAFVNPLTACAIVVTDAHCLLRSEGFYENSGKMRAQR